METYEFMEFLASMGAFTIIQPEVHESKSKKEDDGYLAKGERIYSLRNETIKNIEFKPKPIFDIRITNSRNNRPLDTYKIVEKIANRLVRPNLENIDDFVSDLDLELQPTVSVSNKDRDFSNLFKCTGPLCEVSIPYGKKALTIINGKLGSSSHWGTLRIGCDYVVDYSMLIAELLIFNTVQDNLRKLKSLSNVEESIIYQKLLSLVNNSLSQPICIIKEYFGSFTERIIEEIENAGGEIFQVCRTLKEFNEFNSNPRKVTSNVTIFNRLDAVNLFATRQFCIPNELVLSNVRFVPLIINLFREFHLSYQEDKKTNEYNRSLSGEYATSYMTKKNIPQKILSAMEQSSFNEHFGYVEFDQECDIEKLKVIESEFKELTSVFRQGYLSLYSIRFRKLGKHKAAGLYFPTQGCLCVDIDSPSSLLHEYWHLIDYKHDSLSKSFSFSSIRSLYTELMDKEASKNEEYSKSWNGKSKYNRSYYLEPTEVFARCGELYFVKCLGITNSLTPSKNITGMGYPNDDKLLQLIENYYSNLLQNIKEA